MIDSPTPTPAPPTTHATPGTPASTAPPPAPDAASPVRTHIVIAGHVDDGKSTIVGRLLADAGALPTGKLEQVRAFCERTSRVFEYAFLVDALQDERAQGITIDAARVFFRTDARQYVLIDAPGHVEFLKNMITGAAPADAALLVVDAREGVRETTRRHAIMLAILGVRQLAVLVNKMDLVGHARARFDAVAAEIASVLARLGIAAVAIVPVSGRDGDNVAARSAAMPWYDGPTVLDLLHGFAPTPAPTETPFRMPVQGVYKFTNADDRRIVAGTIESGRLRVGDEVVFYPSRLRSRVRSLEAFNAPVRTQVEAGMASGFTMDPQVYVARGDVAARADEPAPRLATRLRVTLFCLGRRPLDTHQQYLLKIGTARVPAQIVRVDQVLEDDGAQDDAPRDAATDPDARSGSPSAGEAAERAGARGDAWLAHDGAALHASSVERHQVAQCVLRLQRPIAFDRSADIPAMSRFALVDDYEICGGGIVRDALPDAVADDVVAAAGAGQAQAGAHAHLHPQTHVILPPVPVAPAPLLVENARQDDARPGDARSDGERPEDSRSDDAQAAGQTLSLTQTTLSHLTEIARAAGSAILAVRGGSVSLKADGSPVTAADMAAHEIICAALAAWTPSIPIISEETCDEASAADAAAERRGWRRFWLVDPLDGTKEFAAGRPDFAVCIALIEDGVPVMGTIHAPVRGTTYFAARGLGTWRQAPDEPPTRIHAHPPAPGAGLRIVESRSHGSPDLDTFLDRLGVPVASRTPMGSALKFCRLAEGHADCYPRFGPTMAWDVAAGDCLFRNATSGDTPHPSPLTYDASSLRQPAFVLGFVPIAPAVIWLTGLPAAGKSTIAEALCARLRAVHPRVELLDGDEVRRLFPETGFTREAREAHVRRVGHLASRLEHHGVIVVAALVSPYRESRTFARGLCRRFIEVHVSTPLDVCADRDPKGLYARARAGTAQQVTGIDDPYEPPDAADLTIDTSRLTVDEAVERLMRRLAEV